MAPTILRDRARGLPAVAVLLVTAVLGAAPAGSTAALTRLDGQGEVVPGEVLVKLRPGVSAQTRSALLDRNGATTKSILPIPGLRLMRIESGESVADAVRGLEDEAQVLYAEPNYLYRAQATPNDPLFGALWGLDNTGQVVDGAPGTADADIDAPLAWDATTGSSSVTVAVTDTGVAYDHPELMPNIRTNPGESGSGKETNGIDDDGNGLIDDWRGWDFIQNDNDPRDFNGHGTHVAGTIGAAGDNGAGIAGVNWDVGLIPVGVLDGEGSGSNASVTAGFAYAASQGARIVNASLGGGGFSNAMLETIEDSPNTLFVVAAGNEAEDNDFEERYPCNYEVVNIVCVAATDQDDELAGFSNFGAASVDLAAPGTSVLSTQAAYTAAIFSEGFESDIAATWTTGDINDTWARTGEAANSGGFSLTDSPGANYGNNTNSFARNTNSFSLSGQTGCRIEYALALETEFEFDGLIVEAAPDPSGPWTELGSWTGSTGGEFFTLDHDLSAFDGQANVFIRFRLESDFSVVEDGAHIDDVAVQCLTSTYSGDEFRFLAGTSMATPHVAGAAALALADQPGMSTTSLKSALLSNVDFRPGLADLTVTGGRLNAAALLGLVEPDPKPELKPNPGPVTATATSTIRRRSGDRACPAAKRALARAKAKLAKARRALRRAEGEQEKNARRRVSRAARQLTAARKRVKGACRLRAQ